MTDNQRESVPQAPDTSVSYEEVMVNLSERGKLEWELAALRTLSAKLQQEVHTFRAATIELQMKTSEYEQQFHRKSKLRVSQDTPE